VLQLAKFRATLALLILFIIICVATVLRAEDQKEGWSATYDLFRSHFKPLSELEMAFCEGLLKGILYDLDTKNLCNISADCALINQDPFGSTVSIPNKFRTSLKIRMQEYYDRCDDGFSHSVINSNLTHEPVCMEGKCMVRTNKKSAL
jgi:hypothetical protein